MKMRFDSRTGKVLAALLLVLLLASGAVAAAEKQMIIIFVESFDDYKDGEYTGYNGPYAWYQKVGGGGGTTTHFSIVPSGSGQAYKLEAGNGVFVKSFLAYYFGGYVGPKNYIFTSSIKILNGEGGLIFRISGDFKKYYLATVYKDDKKVELYYVDEDLGPGHGKIASANVPSSVDLTDWFGMGVEVVDSNIKISISGTTLINVNDNRLNNGSVGVYTYYGGIALFDNIWWIGEFETGTTTTTVTSTTTKTVTVTSGTGAATVTETATVTTTMNLTETTTVYSTTTFATTETLNTTVTETETETTTETTTVTVTPSTPAEEFDFSLSVSPSSIVLKPGESATSAISVNLLSGEAEPVTLTAAGLPSDFSYVFSPTSVTPSGVSTLQLTAGNTPGTYTLIIQAQGGGKSKTASISIRVEQESRCLIATAAFGSEIAPQVQMLRSFRDGFVMQTFSGKQFMAVFNAFYYSWSPSVAAMERQNPLLRNIVKTLIYPLLASLELSKEVAQPFSATPEVAVLVTGLVASILIGLIYLAPLLAIIYLILKLRKRDLTLNPLYLALPLLASLALFLTAEAFSSASIMMVASASTVLSAIMLGAVAPIMAYQTIEKRRSISS